MKKSNWLVPVLIGLGLLLILLSTVLPQKGFQFNFSKTNFARLIEKSGNVRLQNNEIAADGEVKLNQIINPRDSIRTSENSESVIEFNNGSQFRQTEKSEVLLDLLENGQPLVVLRTGDIFVEKFGKSPSFWVRKEGQLYSAIDYALIDKKSSSHLIESPPDQQDRTQISQLEIESILNSKKNDFFKCYGQLIQKNSQASGQVLISFTIEKHGHTAKIEISKSEISDPNFSSCLVEVVARTQFRSFSGPSVTTVFPLKFE